MLYDLIIIGFGKAGKTLAAEAAAAGLKIAVIERDAERYGGTCINVACLPTKSLINKAKLRRNMAAQGIAYERAFDNAYFIRAIEAKNEMTAKLREKNYRKLADSPNTDVIDAHAEFMNENTLRLRRKDGTEEEIQGRVIVINTGSRPAELNIPGSEDNPHYVNSETAMELNELPARLAIIGGNFIGLEFASMFSGFGSEVTVIHRGEKLLEDEDEDASQAVQDRLEALGVTFMLDAEATALQSHGSEISVTYTESGVEHSGRFDYVLNATGRALVNRELVPEAAGLELTEEGAIQVNEYLQTNVPHIFAVGDAKGGPQFTYVSLDDNRIVSPRILRFLSDSKEQDNDYNLETRQVFPRTIFIDPPYSRVGLSEKQAREQYGDVVIKKAPASSVPKTQVVEETAGFLKVILDPESEQILGATLFSYQSEEVINLVTLAINEKIPAAVLCDQIYNHPVMSEAFNTLLQ